MVDRAWNELQAKIRFISKEPWNVNSPESLHFNSVCYKAPCVKYSQSCCRCTAQSPQAPTGAGNSAGTCQQADLPRDSSTSARLAFLSKWRQHYRGWTGTGRNTAPKVPSRIYGLERLWVVKLHFHAQITEVICRAVVSSSKSMHLFGKTIPNSALGKTHTCILGNSKVGWSAAKLEIASTSSQTYHVSS